MSRKPADQSVNRPPVRFTVESALWALIVVVALTLRLYRLDAAPLAIGEAREALLAWRAVNGQEMPTTGYTPLLFAANAMLFALCSANDALARLWPALLGSALALTPLLFRQRIGRLGAWAAGMYLTVSPTALFAARQLDGATIVAVGVLAWLGGLLRFLDSGRRSWLMLAASGLALAATAGSVACGWVLTFGLAWLGLAWAWPGRRVGELWGLLRPHLLHALVVSLLVALALATGLGWNLAGVGAMGDLVADWFRRFGPVSDGFVASPIVLLVVYEPLALLFGIGGLVWAVRHTWRLGVLLGLWAGLQVVIVSWMPGRLPLDTLGIVLSLALLTGYAVQVLVQSMHSQKVWVGEWLYALVALILGVHFYLRLARYTLYEIEADLFLALLTLILLLFLAAVFVMAAQTTVVLRGFVIGAGVLFLLATLSAGWRLAYVRPSDPRELLTYEPAADTVRDLVGTLRDLSWRKTGMPETLALTLIAPSEPVAAWYLRDFGNLRLLETPDNVQAGQLGPFVVASRTDWTPSDGNYAGQEFVLRYSWDAREVRCVWEGSLQCARFFRWLLFRRGTLRADHSLVLWVFGSAK